MVLDWLSRSHRPPTVDELVAKGRYAQAAAVLRTEIQERTPTLPERLRLADLLVLADHGQQAVPILLGVADELARYGFNDRALEALRRADAVAPGRSEVRDRFEALARTARARIAAAEAANRTPEEKTDPYVPPPARRPAPRGRSRPGRTRCPSTRSCSPSSAASGTGPRDRGARRSRARSSPTCSTTSSAASRRVSTATSWARAESW